MLFACSAYHSNFDTSLASLLLMQAFLVNLSRLLYDASTVLQKQSQSSSSLVYLERSVLILWLTEITLHFKVHSVRKKVFPVGSPGQAFEGPLEGPIVLLPGDLGLRDSQSSRPTSPDCSQQ